MSVSEPPSFQACNCLAIRQAARHVTQFYDQLIAPVGLRTTQFAILSRLKRERPMTINALAAALVRANWRARSAAAAGATFGQVPLINLCRQQDIAL